MTAESIACPACGEPVPFGRRTCEACGAYVTGDAVAARAAATSHGEQATGAETTAAEPMGFDASEPEAPAEPPAIAAVSEAAPPPEVTPEPAPGPEAVVAAVDAGPSRRPDEAFVPAVIREWTAASPVPEAAFAVEAAAAQAGEGAPGVAGAWLPPSTAHRVAPSTTGATSAAVGSGARPWAGPAAPPAPAAVAAPGASEAPVPAAMPPTEGATPQMPASLASMLASSAMSAPRWPSEPAAAPATAPAAERAPRPGEASLLADLPFDAPETLPGWLVAAGGGLAAIAFFLPWVPVISSYFDAWGFGPLAHLPIFLIVVVVTALSIVSNRVATWLRHGVLGLVVGGLLLGLVWNRLFGAAGGQVGVFLEVVAAILLIAGGVLAIGPARRGPEAP